MPRIGFLGAGKMATALAGGFVSAGFAQPGDMLASDVSPAARQAFEQSTGIATTADNVDVLARADVIILALKPQVTHDALMAIRDHFQPRHLLVSIVAGLTLARLQPLIGMHTRAVRVMPNTPALVGAGASAYTLANTAKPEDVPLVQQMLETVGLAMPVPESHLDAVTGLSGSGPAYVFQIIEALSDGGVRMGLARPVATQLAAQTLLGAAMMVLKTGEHPAALKDAVTSPGGTTIAGLHELERGQLRATLMNAVQAATLRSQELGQ